ncbi:tRNA (N(6)-L-threonylcarbamoyladenosine(37)-C(2))-methylthiotransferase, partial [Candidatus Woesearchaeota archaeon]|nr:tRNA (N(6)-L-threonylcarbamoyladenosine(37)-C(2))-methylthiotransferase [Candidatus Woesearchaeota archaeon]
FNTCTVKTPTENDFFTQLEDIKNKYPYKIIVISGCIAQTEKKRLKGYALLGPNQIHHIAEIVEEAINNNLIEMLETGEMPPLNLPKIRKNPIIEIIPISRGCLSCCTFCKTKQARGNLRSYAIEEIVALAEKSIAEGVKEIWLTSQDNFCYGFDLHTDLSELIEELLKLPGQFKIRIGMGNPEHLLKFSTKLFPLYKNDKIFKYIHLPVQSASNKVLWEMKRGHSKEDYLKLVDELKKILPEVTIATDIIVGYPTENEDDFNDTMNLIRTTNPDVVNISRFWPRQGTPAAELRPLPPEIMKKRAKLVHDLFQNTSLLQNEKWREWDGEIIIDEKSEVEGQWLGRNYTYKQVVVEGDFKLGDIVKVRIDRATVFDLRGVVVNS